MASLFAALTVWEIDALVARLYSGYGPAVYVDMDTASEIGDLMNEANEVRYAKIHAK